MITVQLLSPTEIRLEIQDVNVRSQARKLGTIAFVVSSAHNRFVDFLTQICGGYTYSEDENSITITAKNPPRPIKVGDLETIDYRFNARRLDQRLEFVLDYDGEHDLPAQQPLVAAADNETAETAESEPADTYDVFSHDVQLFESTRLAGFERMRLDQVRMEHATQTLDNIVDGLDRPVDQSHFAFGEEVGSKRKFEGDDAERDTKRARTTPSVGTLGLFASYKEAASSAIPYDNLTTATLIEMENEYKAVMADQFKL